MPVHDTQGSSSGQAVWSLVDALLADGQSHSGPKTAKDGGLSPAPAAPKRSLQWVLPASLALLALAAFAAFYSNDFRGGGSSEGVASVARRTERPAETVTKPKQAKKQPAKRAATAEVAYVPAASSGSKPKSTSAPKASPAPKSGGKPRPQPSKPADPPAAQPEQPAIELPQLPVDLSLLGLGS